jgi:hypothetical protein
LAESGAACAYSGGGVRTDGEQWTMPAAIEDPKVLDEIGVALKEKGVGG